MDFEAGKSYSENIDLPKGFKKDQEPNIVAGIRTLVNNKQHTYYSYLRSIKYDHIPAIHYFFQNNATIVSDEVKVAGKKLDTSLVLEIKFLKRFYNWGMIYNTYTKRISLKIS